MKRREFARKLIGIALGSSVFSAFGKSYLKKTSKTVHLQKEHSGKLVKTNGGEIILPDNPDYIRSFFHIEFEKKQKLKLISRGQKIVQLKKTEHTLNKSGTYVVQYLGPEYGWSVL